MGDRGHTICVLPTDGSPAAKKSEKILGKVFQIQPPQQQSVLGYFDFSFSVRPDKRVDVLLAAATEYKQLAFR